MIIKLVIFICGLARSISTDPKISLTIDTNF